MQQFRNIIARSAACSTVAATLCGLALGSGCNKDTSAGGGGGGKNSYTVGIVDLPHISSQVGWLNDIENDRKASEKDVVDQLTTYLNSIVAAWDAKKRSIGENAHLSADQLKTLNGTNGDDIAKLPLTRDQRDEFLQCANQANATANEARQYAQKVLQERAQKVEVSYRETMKPSVRRVAVAAGVSIVEVPANAIYYDPGVDLSDQVVDDLRKAMPGHTMPEMPKLDFKPFKFQPVNAPPAALVAPAAPAAPAVSRPAVDR